MYSRDTWECVHSWETPPISPIWPDLNSSASTCAWSVILELSERPRQGEGFPSPLWFIQYLANLALNLPHEISIHSGPPLPRHTWTTCLLDLVPSHALLRCTFATTPHPHSLSEWETGPCRGARVRSSPLPPAVARVTYWSQCAALSLSTREGIYGSPGLKRKFYGAGLAAKGQPLSQLL